MSLIEIIPEFKAELQLPVLPVSMEKTEPLTEIKDDPETQIVEITVDDILHSSDEENIPHIKDAHSNISQSKNLDKTKDKDDISIRGRKPQHSEETHKSTCDKTVESTLSEKDNEETKITEAPVIPVGPYEYTSLAEDKYVCNHCQHASNSLEYVKLHIETEHREITQMCQCPYCSYSSKLSLQYHVIHKHKDIKDVQWFHYRCDNCDYKTCRRDTLKRHKVIHLKPKEICYFYCHHCCREFKRKYELTAHILKHFQNEEVPFHCYGCNFKTSKRVLIIRHIKKQHCNKTKSKFELETRKRKCDEGYCCSKCDYKTDIYKNLKRHKLNHLKPEESEYFHCYHCSLKMKRKDHLRIHIFKHFRNGEVTFHCYRCDFMTLKRKLIIEHIETHANFKLSKLSRQTEAEMYDGNLKYCDKCNYNTLDCGTLNRHKVLHLEPEKIHYLYCNHCSYKSHRKDLLRTHIFKHFKKEEITFHCYICDFTAPKRDLIIKHIKKHAKLKPCKAKKHHCDKCAYSASTRSLLDRHKMIHLKPEEIQFFHCDHCSYKSKRKYDLRAHILRHFKRGEVAFHCYVCDFITIKRNLIIEHLKGHTKSKPHDLSHKLKTKKYHCDKCDYHALVPHQLKRHKLIHLKPVQIQYFYCYHCSHKTKRKDHLKIHIFKHFKNEEVTFHCYVCDFKTPKRKSITKHIKKHSN